MSLAETFELLSVEQTYNMAYMILEANTSLLPISRCLISSGDRPSVIALFVPQRRTKWTRPIRAINGIMLQNMILSSRKSFSVLTYRPDILTRMMATANPVHHHETRRVALSSCFVLAGGGLE